MKGFMRRLLFVLCCLPLVADGATRRLAIVVGNNAGVGVLPPLRYAESDAGKVARVLVELGDVASKDLFLLQGQGPRDLERVLEDVKERVQFLKQQPDVRSMLMFYFSGHSDGESIEMGKERVAFSRLKSWLTATGADLRLSIVDSCRSGQALKEKGGQPAPAFTIKLSDAIVASGEAFISSSAADEAALESSEVMGSLFTHNLVSGLRGAADVSGDHQVTLSEVYQYAYERTVAATAMLTAGAQHPNYDLRLSGQGELILSSLLLTSASLYLPDDMERAWVIDLTRDQIIAEFSRSAGREIGLPPGPYGLQVFKEGKPYGGRVELFRGKRREVQWTELKLQRAESRMAQKGASVSSAYGFEDKPPLVWLGGGFSRGALLTKNSFHGLARLGWDFSEGSGWNVVAAYSQGATLGVNETSWQGRVGYRWVGHLGAWYGGIGAEVGPSLFVQQVAAQVEATSVGWTLAPKAFVRWKFSTAFWLNVEAEYANHLVRVDDGWTFLHQPALSAGVGMSLP